MNEVPVPSTEDPLGPLLAQLDPEVARLVRDRRVRQGTRATVRWLRRRARHVDGDEAALLLHAAAELQLADGTDRGKAVPLLHAALEKHPTYAAGADRLQRLLFQLGREDDLERELVRWLAALVERCAEGEVVADAHYRIGALLERADPASQRALHAYQRALSFDPAHERAVIGARRIFAYRGEWHEVERLFLREAELAASPAAWSASLRALARFRHERLDDPGSALEALSEAHKALPEDLGLIEDMAAMLGAQAQRVAEAEARTNRRRAAELYYYLAGRAPDGDEAHYLQAALSSAPEHDAALDRLLQVEGIESPRSRELATAYLEANPFGLHAERIRMQLAACLRDEGNTDAAIEMLEPLLHLGHEETAETLVALYQERGQHEDEADALELLVSLKDGPARVAALRQLVHLLEEIDGTDRALPHAHAILESDPADTEMVRFCVDAHCLRGEPSEAVDVLQKALSVETSERIRVRWLERMAEIGERELGDHETSLAAWRQVLEIDPLHTEGPDNYVRLLEVTGRWDELASELEARWQGTTSHDERVALLERLVQVHGVHRDDRVAEVEALVELIKLGSKTRDRVRSVDDRLRSSATPDAAVEHVLTATEDGAWNPDARVALLRVAGRALEGRGHEERAYEASFRLLGRVAGDPEALDRMERIDDRASNAERLLDTLELRAEAVVDAAERGRIFQRMASIARQELDDAERAAELYGRAWAELPGDEAAFDALCELYMQLGRHGDVVALLRERASTAADLTGRIELLKRAARVLTEHLADDEASAVAWREVVELTEDIEALSQLAANARRQGNASELELTLRRLMRAETDDEPWLRYGLERARVLAEELECPNEAIELLWEMATDQSPPHPAVLEALEAQCDALGDRRRLAEALELTYAGTDAHTQRVELAMRIADLYEHDVGDVGNAIVAAERWRDEVPELMEPRARLLALYEKAARWPSVVECLDEMAAGAGSEPTRWSLLRRAAWTEIEQVGDIDAGWKRLLTLVDAGDAEAEELLIETARRTSRGEALAQVYLDRLASASGIEERDELFLRAARILRDLVPYPARRLELLLPTFHAEDASFESLRAVEDVAADAHAWSELTQLFGAVLDGLGDATEERRLLLRHADTLEARGYDPSAAFEWVARGLRAHGGDAEVLARAERLAERSGKLNVMARIWGDRARETDEVDERERALLRAAELAARSKDGLKQALPYLEEALVDALYDGERYERIRTTFRQLEGGVAGSAADFVSLHRRAASQPGVAPEAVAELLLRAARLQRDELGDTSSAFETLRHASHRAPQHEGLLAELEQLARDHDLLPVVAHHLDQLLEEVTNPDEAAPLLWRRARISEDLERYGEAEALYLRLAAMAPGDPELDARLGACRTVEPPDRSSEIRRRSVAGEAPEARVPGASGSGTAC